MENNGAKDFLKGGREMIGPVTLSMSLTSLFQVHIILYEHVHIKNGGLRIA